MRISRAALFAVSPAVLAGVAGCHLPGRPKPEDVVVRPQSVTNFEKLYGENCAGCHGNDGQNGPATNLANPEYQALVDDASLREITANGEKATLMPGFGTSSGGLLTPVQIDAIVKGMRDRWFKGNVLAGQNAPPYKATEAGDTAHGGQVYQAACAHCHGATTGQPGSAGSILDGSFLALINPQTIRTTVIAGRPDVGQPDWRGDIPGHPLSDADVTDVTAWLMAQRPASPGQPYPNSEPTSKKPGEEQPTAPFGMQPGQSQRSHPGPQGPLPAAKP